MENNDQTPLEKALDEITGEGEEKEIVDDGEVSLLIFSLANQCFTIPAEMVEQITPTRQIHFIPLVPSFIRGVIPWQSEVVPVLDLNLILNLAANRSTLRPRLIYAQCGELRAILSSEWVVDVIDFPRREIHTPREGETMGIPLHFLQGYANYNQQLITLLDLEGILHHCHQSSPGEP